MTSWLWVPPIRRSEVPAMRVDVQPQQIPLLSRCCGDQDSRGCGQRLGQCQDCRCSVRYVQLYLALLTAILQRLINLSHDMFLEDVHQTEKREVSSHSSSLDWPIKSGFIVEPFHDFPRSTNGYLYSLVLGCIFSLLLICSGSAARARTELADRRSGFLGCSHSCRPLPLLLLYFAF